MDGVNRMEKSRIWLLATKGLLCEFMLGIITREELIIETDELEKLYQDYKDE